LRYLYGLREFGEVALCLSKNIWIKATINLRKVLPSLIPEDEWIRTTPADLFHTSNTELNTRLLIKECSGACSSINASLSMVGAV
jgi:hypothetical protein